MAMLPWFNKYPYTDFHELNIDWLCNAYSNFIEQLKAFDTRLDGIETDVDTRLDAMEGDISSFKTEVTAQFTQLSTDIQAEFDSLESSFDARFTQLENNLTSQMETLRAEIEQEFAEKSEEIDAKITELEDFINSSLNAMDVKIDIIEEVQRKTVANEVTSGLFNYMSLPVNEALFEDHQDTLTANAGEGSITVSGTTPEEMTVTIAGGPDSFPAGMDSIVADMVFGYSANVISEEDDSSGPLRVDVIFYENEQESVRYTGTRSLNFYLDAETFDSLSGIEITLTAENDVLYGIRYMPTLMGRIRAFTNSTRTFYRAMNDIDTNASGISAINQANEVMNSKNIALPSVDKRIELPAGLITANNNRVIIQGVVAEDTTVGLGSIYLQAPESISFYFTSLRSHVNDVYFAIANRITQAITYFTEIDTYYDIELSDNTPYEFLAIIPAGDYSNAEQYYPYASYNMSNKQLEEITTDLKERVDDIDDTLMGETTYGPEDLITFTDPVGNVPLKEIIAYVDPLQDLHGYENPWPGGATKNLIDAPDKPSAAAGDKLYDGSVNLPAGTYTLSSSNTTGTVSVLGVGAGVMPYTFTLADAITSLTIEVVTAGAYNNIQLESGSAATSFIPYKNICPISGSSNIEIKRYGKNLLPNKVYQYQTGRVNLGIDYRDMYYLPLNPGTYKFTAVLQSQAKLFYREINAASSIQVGDYTGTPLTITIAQKGLYTFWLYKSSGFPASDVISFMLEEGTTATSYEEYTEVEITIPIGQTVYGGYYNNITGKFVLTHQYAKLTDLVRNSWAVGTRAVCYRVNLVDYSTTCTISQKHGAVSNMLPEEVAYLGVSRPNEASKDCFAITTDGQILALYDTDISLSEADFLAKYDDFEIAYPLASTQEISLTAEELFTLKGINNITNSAGRIQVTTFAFVENMIRQFTERYIVTFDGTDIDKTFAEILEAYTEGRRVVIAYNDIYTELNQYDADNGQFQFEWNDFTSTGIIFNEIIIDSTGATYDSKSITI